MSDQPIPKEQNQEKKIGRRELLKALAATGGAITAASAAPGKWTKPVIEAGVLPAHAQASPLNLQVRVVNAGAAFNNVGVTGDKGGNPQELEIEAEVIPNMAGVAIEADPDPGGTTQTETTNASGIATFFFFACELIEVTPTGTGPSTTPFSIEFSFANQATYGDDTETVTGEVLDSFCED